MRNIKKNFFETLIRLTILANVLRQTNRIDFEPLFNSHNYIVKQNLYQNKTSVYLDDILLYNRFSYLIAPASFLPSTPSQKDLINNLIHDNSFNKEDLEMEIDLQTILQQDIDLGIRSTSPNSLEYNYYFEGNLSKQTEFYQETQKNADILATTDLFEHNHVPEGYKLVLEEDTGEYFLILMTNESNKTEYSKIQIKESDFVNNLLTNTTNKTSDSVFLNQVSINQELDKLNEDLNFNSTNLDDSLSNLDSVNLLDETWITQLLVDSEQQQNELMYDQIKINDDKMLSKLNENQTFVLSPPLVQTNYLINETIYNDTVQFESMLDHAIMAHEKEMNKNETFLENKQLEEFHLSNFLNYTDDTVKLNSTMKILTLSNLSNTLKISSDDDKAKILADDRVIFNNNNNNNYNNNTNNNVYEIELKQEFIESEHEPKLYNNEIAGTSVQTPALSGFMHNHTYLATGNSDEDSLIHHPYSYKNKLKKMLKNMKKSDGEKSEKHVSRDEQLLRENKISLSLQQIVDTSADEFNDLIREYALNNDQVIVAKDIRRRGKNKVAAQICRKRKLDSIDILKENVYQLEQKRSTLCSENLNLQKEIREATARFNKLYQDAIGSSLNMNDPTIMSINNLREQLNTKEVQTSEAKYDDSSFSNLTSTLNNETEDEDYEIDDEDDSGSDFEDDGDEEENSLNSSMFSSSRRQQPGNVKKMRKF